MGVTAHVLENALAGTALILVCAVLRRALKHRLPPGVRLWLWGICLFRLLTPAAPVCPWSLWGLLPRREMPAASRMLAAAMPPAGGAQPPRTADMLPAVLYALGGAAVLAWFVWGWTRARREVLRAPALAPGDPRYETVPRCARLREGPVKGAPLTFGVLRPTIVLAPGLEGRDLAAVLAHEGVHARRRDNLWHYVMALAQVLYWWDPAVWLMARLLRRDVELSCDRAVAAAMSRRERAEYARAILDFSTQAEGLPFCRQFGQKQAEERILAMLNFKKMSVVGTVLSLALVATLGTALATAPKEDVEAEPMNTECFGTLSGCEFDGTAGDEDAPVAEAEYSFGIEVGAIACVAADKDGTVSVASIKPTDMQPVTEEELAEQIQKLEEKQAQGSLDATGMNELASSRQMLEDLKNGGKIYRYENSVEGQVYIYVGLTE